MAFGNSNQSKLSIDNAAGSLVDITCYVADVGHTDTRSVSEVTTLCKTGAEYIPGISDGGLTLSGPLDDSTFWTLVTGILNQQATSAGTYSYQWRPFGDTAGKPQVTGEFLVTQFNQSASSNELVDYNMQVQRSGVPTYGVVPA